MYYDSVAKAVIVPDSVRNESKVEQDVHRKQSLEHARGAQKMFKQGLYGEAAQAFSRAIQEYPDDPSFYSNRALCYLEIGSYESAVIDCNIALKSDPKSIKFLYRKGLALFGAGRVTEAIECLLQTFSLTPSETELNEINEKLGIFCESLEDSERTAWKIHIADAKKQVTEGWSTSKKESATGSKEKKTTDPFMDPANPLQAQTLWIANLVGSMANEKELKRLLKPFGKAISITLGNKCAYVTMASADAAANVLGALQGYDFYGTTLVVRYKLGGPEANVSSVESKQKADVKALANGIASVSIGKEATMPRATSSNGLVKNLPPPLLPTAQSQALHKTVCLEPLPNACNEDDLWQIAAQFGQIVRASISRERRAGFIEYADVRVALAASKALHGFPIFGFPVTARLMDDGSDLRSPILPLSPCPTVFPPTKNAQKPGDGPKLDKKVLWLGNLCPEMDNNSVMTMFKKFHPIHVCVFSNTNSAFVNFANETDAANAMRELQGAKVSSWILKIEYKKIKS